MGQKVNPISFRTGYIKGWQSHWMERQKPNYIQNIIQDEKMRNHIDKCMPNSSISKIVIQRTIKRITLNIHTAKPGLIIGKGGAAIDKLREELKKITPKSTQINVLEVKKPNLNARIVAEGIARQLGARMSYRRIIKHTMAGTMRAGAEGIKITLKGRLNGAEIARHEKWKEGRIPQQTLRADIDYHSATARTKYGTIGVKVWIYNGEVRSKRDLTPAAEKHMASRNKTTRKPRYNA